MSTWSSWCSECPAALKASEKISELREEMKKTVSELQAFQGKFGIFGNEIKNMKALLPSTGEPQPIVEEMQWS